MMILVNKDSLAEYLQSADSSLNELVYALIIVIKRSGLSQLIELSSLEADEKSITQSLSRITDIQTAIIYTRLLTFIRFSPD